MGSEDLVEEVGCLDLVKDSTAVSVVVVPKLVDNVSDELLLRARKQRAFSLLSLVDEASVSTSDDDIVSLMV